MGDTFQTIEELNNEEAKIYIGGVVFVSIIMITGIIGNLHVLFVYTFKMPPSNHRIFILVLAVLDFITCIVGMPFIIVDLRNPLTFQMEHACKVLRFVNYFICDSSALILLVIAVDRYRKICVPLGKQISQRVAKYLCLLMLGISLLFSWPAPVLYGHGTVETVNPNITGVRCYTEDKYKSTKHQAYFNAVLILIVFGVFFVLVVLYSLIGKAISKHNTFKGPSNVPYKSSAEEQTQSVTADVTELKASESSGDRLCNDNKEHQKSTRADTENKEGKPTEKSTKCVETCLSSGTSTQSSGVTAKTCESNTVPKHVTQKEKTKTLDRTTRTTFMFFLITAVFFISYVPHLVLKILTFVNKDFVADMSFTGKVLYNTFIWCFFINNMANCFVYGFLDIRFRAKVKEAYNNLLCRK